MVVWPFQPPQSFQIPVKKSNDNGEVINEEILQVLSVPQSNCLIILTRTRVLLYNYKPLALIACHNRTESSVSELGGNKFSISDSVSRELFEGLISDDALNDIGSHRGKIALYVITEKNFIMVYQLLLTVSSTTIFKEYGIPVSEIYEMDSENGRGIMEENDDDEILTVFAKKDAHKVIQNGYAIDKQQGFLQFLNKSPETMDELPIKRVELRLKIILKFDHKIIDMIAIRETNFEEDNVDNQHLLILFPHGLQVINLRNFKLENNSLVQVTNGQKMFEYRGKVHVLSPTSGELFINTINFTDLTVDSKKVDTGIQEEILNVFSVDEVLVLVYKNQLVYYDPINEIVMKRWTPSSKIERCEPLAHDTLLLFSAAGNLEILTKWANYIFSTSNEDTDEQSAYSHFSNFTFIDNSLFTTAKGSQFFKLDLWHEVNPTISDFRNPVTFILHDNNNDIMLYSPTHDSSNVVNFQVIKLPTKTINNFIAQVKVNGTLTMLTTLIGNKNILLVHDLKANIWHSFNDVNILDMCWLGNEYLICRILDETSTSECLRCYHFVPARFNKVDIADYLIWNYSVPPDTKILDMHVNTLTRYKMLKIKSKNPKEEVIDNVFKTAEIVLTLANNKIRTIDVLSHINGDGSNAIIKFHPLPVQILPENLVDRFEWVMSFKEGYLALGDAQLFKVEKLGDESWQCTVLLKKVEKILDLVFEDIFIVHDNSIEVYSLDELWLDKPYSAILPISDNDYPIAVSPESAVIHSLHCVFYQNFSKLVTHQTIYLDQLIDHSLSQRVPVNEIDAKYHSLKHYKFTLEKLLSSKVLSNAPLSELLDLIDTYDEGPESRGKLEIISNCLRKIEIEHWDYLFTKLNLTPRDLLVQCVEQNEARVLGILLMVFLNYEGGQNASPVNSSNLDSKQLKTKGKKKNKKTSKHKMKSDTQNLDKNGTFSGVLDDEDLILQVLKILVNTAAFSTVPEEAQEFWDMSFQLVRFIKALDNDGSSSLVQKSIQLLG